MALTDENNSGFYMPVAPAYGGNNGFGGFGGDWGWIVLLLLLAGGGWGNGFGGGFGGYGNMMLGYDFPWILNGQNAINANTNSGFRDAMLNDGIGAINSGISGLSTQLCNGFAGTTSAITGAQNAISSQLYANQITDLQQAFALQSQLAQCCCDNRAATADLKYTVATEACADRQAVSDALKDVLAANTASTQRILDQLCQDKIDAKNDEISRLRSQINELSRTASQNAQTAAILTDNLAQTNALEQYLAPVPRPAYIVQNPNCCTNTCGCGTF